MGGYGPPGRQTGGGWCAVWFVCLAIIPLMMLAACADTKRVVQHLPTPPERLICERAGTRPTLPPEHLIDWSQVRTVAAAKVEHDKFVSVLRTREGLVAGYVLRVEGELAKCWINMTWRKEYEAGIGR